MPVPGGMPVPGVVAEGAGAGGPEVPLLSQVTVNAFPLVSAEGVASVTPLADTMVRPLGFSLPSAVLSALTPVKLTVPKFDSGSTDPAPALGAPASTSAEPSCAAAEVWLVVWFQPWVVSVKVSVNVPPPLATTEALIASPGWTGLS